MGSSRRRNTNRLHRLNVVYYRQYFSAVFADLHLFDEIFCAVQDEAALRAKRYLGALGLAHKVELGSNRFSTDNLSLGQRKRMALVSSYLDDRPIYLFDKWAADQDPDFKRIFYTELLPELKSRGRLPGKYLCVHPLCPGFFEEHMRGKELPPLRTRGNFRNCSLLAVTRPQQLEFSL